MWEPGMKFWYYAGQHILANYNVHKLMHPLSMLTKVRCKDLVVSKVPVPTAYELEKFSNILDMGVTKTFYTACSSNRIAMPQILAFTLSFRSFELHSRVMSWHGGSIHYQSINIIYVSGPCLLTDSGVSPSRNRSFIPAIVSAIACARRFIHTEWKLLSSHLLPPQLRVRLHFWQPFLSTAPSYATPHTLRSQSAPLWGLPWQFNFPLQSLTLH